MSFHENQRSFNEDGPEKEESDNFFKLDMKEQEKEDEVIAPPGIEPKEMVKIEVIRKSK